MAENPESLLIKIIDIFKCKGVQNITMEQISQYLGISKRTLYKYFPNKQNIADKSFEYLTNYNFKICEEINLQSEDAIEALLLRVDHQNKFMAEYSKMLQDNLELMLNKGISFKESIGEKHRNLMMDLMQKNIERGQKEGLYRKEINAFIIVHYYSMTMEYYVLNQLPFLMVNLIEFSRQLLTYHIHGMATLKGLEKLDKHLKKHQLFSL